VEPLVAATTGTSGASSKNVLELMPSAGTWLLSKPFGSQPQPVSERAEGFRHEAVAPEQPSGGLAATPLASEPPEAPVERTAPKALVRPEGTAEAWVKLPPAKE